MSNLTEYITQMQNLTKKNLEILKGINQAFYTNAEHLSVTVDEETYIIPSFISLENKINSLQDNFENLVNAPKTGEAAFDFNGNTQVIEMKGYSNTPAVANIINSDDTYLDFDFNHSHLFKDLCTPQPFVKIDLSSIPSDIQNVNVKKIVPKNATLLSMFADKIGTNVDIAYKYSDLYKELFGYEEGTDYVEYDTVYSLPVRDNIAYGSYKIQSIDKNWTDDDLDEHYTLTLDTLYYYTNNESLQNTIKPGDYLLTSNDVCKLLVEDVKISTSTITVKVEDGAYVDLTTYENSDQLGVLKFFPNQDWTNYKYLNLPLEEDQYVFVFVAPIQRTSHIQSSWGVGIFFNTFNLKCDIDGITYYYKDYYDKFVNNVGDTLAGITSMFGISLVNFTQAQFDSLTQLQPVIDKESLAVLEINKHLSNSDTIQELYGLYGQKQQYKSDLKNIQGEIDEINNLLSTTDFTNNTQNRTIYEQQLNSLNTRKKETVANINNLIQEISIAATDTDVPIDNPKYHIRGFYDYTFINRQLQDLRVQVIGIDVQYRYKNANRSTGTATHIGESENIFSDWNQMNIVLDKRRAKFEGVSTGFSYAYEGDNTNKNEISFNQIDIPITQGETVDIRLRVIYNIGQPFIEITSSWSEIVNIEFPVELKKNITVLDIINDNNEDVSSSKFTAILDQYQVLDHVDDKIVDQNEVFFHNPSHISSGFYTSERRVIPLFDKLKSLEDLINTLQDEVEGSETENLTVTLSDSTHTTTVIPFTSITHTVPAYFDTNKENGQASEVLNLNIANTSNHIVKIFSIIPGDSNDNITLSSRTRYNMSDYAATSTGGGVRFIDMNDSIYYMEPVYNQWLYFRIRSLYNGYNYNINYTINTSNTSSALYPVYTYMKDKSASETLTNVIIPSSGIGACMVLQPGESLNVPLLFKYFVKEGESTEKTLSFDIRTSLYNDPINYVFNVQAKYIDNLKDKLTKLTLDTKYNPIVVNAQAIQTPQVSPKVKFKK